MLNTFRVAASTFKEALHDRFFAKTEELEVKEAFKERKLALYFLIVSAVVLLLKLSGHRVGDAQWADYVSLAAGKSSSAAIWLWMFVWSLEWIITPVLSGLAMAVVTWYTVFLDSYIPGVYPPSPLSPRKSRQHSRTFHMGYYLAVINGLLIGGVILHANLAHPSTL